MYYKANPSNEETLEFIKKLLERNVILSINYSHFENQLTIDLKGKIDGEMMF